MIHSIFSLVSSVSGSSEQFTQYFGQWLRNYPPRVSFSAPLVKQFGPAPGSGRHDLAKKSALQRQDAEERTPLLAGNDTEAEESDTGASI